MREIKFRALCYDDKMVYWGIGQEEPDFNNIASGAIMQYTGLKDKNGVEIYESDLIKYNCYGGGITEVRFIFGCYSFSAGGVIVDLYNPDLKLEVVGNIYENPELLDA